MNITLNGNIYHLAAGTNVKRSPIIEWPENLRLQGQQRRQDRRLISSYVIEDWSNGLLVERENSDVATLSARLWDVENCDTRNNSIILSPALNTCTIVPSRGDLNLPLFSLNNLYLCQTGTENSTRFQFSPPFTFGSYRQLATGTSEDLLGILGIGDKIVFIGGVNPNIQKVNALGSIFPFSLLPDGITATLPYASFVNCGGTIHCLYYGSYANFVIINSALTVSIGGTIVGTVSETIGTYLAPLTTDGLEVYAHLPDGVYHFDETPSVIIDTQRVQDLNCTQTIFRNNLYFKNFKNLIKYDGAELTSIGIDRLDGLPVDKFGEITALFPTWKYLFTAVKGATYSHILTFDGDAWQYYTRIPTAGIWVRNLFVNSSPDGIERLWCLFGNYGIPGYFLNPIINPLQAATYSFVPTGYFTKPIFDGGLVEESGAFLDMRVIADGLGSNNITAFYGINGATPITTLGVISTTNQQHLWGSPYGIEAYRIQPKFMLSGANSGTTPIFRSAVIHYLKQPEDREEFGFTIDLEETAQAQSRPLEAVIGSLNSEKNQKTLLPFWYGQIPTKTVKITEMPAQEKVEKDRTFPSERKGLIDVRVAEIL